VRGCVRAWQHVAVEAGREEAFLGLQRCEKGLIGGGGRETAAKRGVSACTREKGVSASWESGCQAPHSRTQCEERSRRSLLYQDLTCKATVKEVQPGLPA
jgi:hypothetical protein